MLAGLGGRLRLWSGVILLWLLLSVGLVADAPSAGALAAPSSSGDTTGQAVPPAQKSNKEAPFDCSRIKELGIDRQMNLRAAQIMQQCSGQPASSNMPSAKPVAPITSKALIPNYGVGDVNLITGGETSPHVTQSESFVWSEGNTIVVNYNDSTGAASSQYSGMSYSTNGGATFTRILPSPFATGHGNNFGDPIVVFNREAGLWYAGDLASGCGGQGVGLWTSPNGITWTAGACAHNGSGDDRESMWVDNTPILPSGLTNPFYGRMYISLAVSGGALTVVYSDNGTTWTTVTLSAVFIRDVQVTGGPDGAVFVAACDENGGGLANPRDHVMYRSTNGGVSWTNTTMAASQASPGDSTCSTNSYFAQINPIWRYMGWGQPGVGPNGVVHYAYTRHGAGADAGDVYYVRSANNGSTWSAPIRLDTDASTQSQWMPSLSVTTWGAVTVSWYDRRNTTNGSNYQYRSRVSRDNGLTWGPDEAVSDVIIPQPAQPDPNVQSCYAGDYNYHSASDDAAYLTWTDGRNQVSGTNQQDVYFDKIAEAQGNLTCDTYTFTAGGASIVAGATDIGNHCDDCVTSIALPFQFRLYDTAFNSVNVSSNGNLQFNSSRADLGNNCLPYTPFSYAILAHWDDMRTDGAGEGVFTSISGAAPTRIFNIEWRAHYFSGAGTAGFEVRLYEALPSKFDIVIGTLGQGGLSATIGVQQDTGSNYTVATCNQAVGNGRLFSFALQAHGNYSTSTSTGNSIVPGTLDIGNHFDDGVTQVSLPFLFRVYDVSFNTMFVSSNGNLQFNSSVADFTNACLPYTGFNYAIMPHWDDLTTTTAGDGVFTSVSGFAPNRIFNIEWRAHYFDGSGSINFEVRLYEAVNKFDIIYGAVPESGSSATVGVQRDSGSLSTQFECNTAATLSSGLKVTFTMAPCLCGAGSDYYVIPSSAAAIDPGTTLVPSSQCDDCTVLINLPFTYNLYDQTFSQVRASSNGNLQFVSNVADFTNSCLPYSGFNYAILPHWDDLITSIAGDGIYTSQSGGVFNIEWRAHYFNNSAQVVNFEVRLFQTQNKFEVVYGQIDQGGSSATVGVQRDSGSMFTTFECNTASSLVAGRRLTFQESPCNNILIGHVTWQGRPAQPNVLQQVPITLTLKLGNSEFDYPSQTTDASGFFTEPVTGFIQATYNWRVKDPKYLANCGTLTLSGLAVTNQEMGLMKGGDSDNNNIVNVADFNILKGSFGRSIGQVGYDDRADFTGDQTVNAQDFNIQKGNFAVAGCGAITPGQPKENPKDTPPPDKKK